MPLSSAIAAALAALGALTLLRWLMVRRLRARVVPSIRSASALAVLGFLQQAAATAAITYGALFGALWVLERAQVDFADGPAAVFFDIVLQARSTVGGIGRWWSLAIVVGLLGAAVYLLRRRTMAALESDPAGAARLLAWIGGATAVLGSGTRWLGRAGLVAFLLMLVATSSLVGFADRLDLIVVRQAAAAAADDLRFARAEARAEPEAPNPGAAGREDDADGSAEGLDEAVDRLARAFEQGVSRARPFNGAPPPHGAAAGRGASGGEPHGRDAAKLRAYLVREAVLDVAARHAPASAGLRARAGFATAGGLDGPMRRAAGLVRAAVASGGPATRLGEVFAARLRAEMSALAPARRAEMIAATRAMAAARARDAVAMSLMELAGNALDATIGTGDRALVRVLQGMAGEAVAPMLTRAAGAVVDVALRRALVTEDLAGFADDVAGALDAARMTTVREQMALHGLAARSPGTVRLWDVARRYPPAVASDAGAAAGRAGEDAVRTMAGRFAGRAPDTAERLTDALATYEDFFPGRYGDEARSRRGRLLAGMLGGRFEPPPGPGSGGPLDAISPGSGADRYRRSAARARSYASLRGFARVGGVLIGRAPERVLPPGPDIRGLTWRNGVGGMRLVLHHADGTTTELGPYAAGLVHRALAYAADGRPVAVTMTEAPPLAELRVLLHPALVDTPTGCRAIEADRFVDRFVPRGAEAAGPVAVAERRAAAQIGLYDFAVFVRAKALADKIRRRPAVRSRLLARADLIGRYALVAGKMPAAADLRFAPADFEMLRDEERSPVAANPHLFDPATVDAIWQCRAVKDRDSLRACLVAGPGVGGVGDGRLLDMLDEVLRPGPGAAVWSGVRERAYDIDAGLSFLDPGGAATADNVLWPLRFILQIAFDTEPVRTWAGAAVPSEAQPWTFPAIQPEIARVVRTSLEHPRDRRILADMRAFTVLQRLFRAAFADRLGTAFPLHVLVDLAEATGAAAKASATPRWRTWPNRLETFFAEQLRALRPWLPDAGWTGELGEDIDRCVAMISKVRKAQGIPADIWNGACRFDAYEDRARKACAAPVAGAARCLARNIVDMAALRSDARAMRRSLGVASSSAVESRIAEQGCAPLR